MAVYETILSRLKRRNKGGGYGSPHLFSDERSPATNLGLGVQENTGPSFIQLKKGGKVLGYTERWKKARGN